jgi:hypothetical protein
MAHGLIAVACRRETRRLVDVEVCCAGLAPSCIEVCIETASPR